MSSINNAVVMDLFTPAPLIEMGEPENTPIVSGTPRESKLPLLPRSLSLLVGVSCSPKNWRQPANQKKNKFVVSVDGI